MKKKDKNKTLIGLIMKSETSGAIYYWKRGNNTADVIECIPVPKRTNAFGVTYEYDRSKGMLVPFNEASVGIKDNKIIITNGLGWTVLKEIHN